MIGYEYYDLLKRELVARLEARGFKVEVPEAEMVGGWEARYLARRPVALTQF